MISIQVEEKADPNWNKLLLRSTTSSIYQTAEMGKHFENQGQKPLFLKFIDQRGEIIGLLLLTTYSRFDNKGKKGKILKKVPGIKKLVYDWTYGPVVFNEELFTEVYSTLGKFLLSNKCRISGKTNPFQSGNPSALSKNFQIIDWCTYFIDLSKTKEEIYKKIDKHSGQKNIERSKNRGVQIEEITENSLIDYVDLKNKTMSNLEKNIDISDALRYWRLLKPVGYSGYLAKKDGIVLGGLMFSTFNKLIIEGGVVRSVEDFKNKLYSQDLIKWKIIEWGVENSMKFYDLAGFNPHPQSKKEEGINRYKEKWGGEKRNYWLIKK